MHNEIIIINGFRRAMQNIFLKIIIERILFIKNMNNVLLCFNEVHRK